MYQHLMTYWNDTMQDDCYLIAADGWKAELTNINKGKKGNNIGQRLGAENVSDRSLLQS
ncbi:MAG: hypothetical protein WDN75_14610 [Bacteroidota bacterium]